MCTAVDSDTVRCGLLGVGWLRHLAGCFLDAYGEKVPGDKQLWRESSLRFLQINTQVCDCARSSSDQRRLY